MATNNSVWKRNRNFHAMLLLDQVINNKLDKPFSGLPPEGGLPALQEHEVVHF